MLWLHLVKIKFPILDFKVNLFLVKITQIKGITLVPTIIFLAPAVTVGETEGAMDSASVFFTFSFGYNFVRK